MFEFIVCSCYFREEIPYTVFFLVFWFFFAFGYCDPSIWDVDQHMKAKKYLYLPSSLCYVFYNTFLKSCNIGHIWITVFKCRKPLPVRVSGVEEVDQYFVWILALVYFDEVLLAPQCNPQLTSPSTFLVGFHSFHVQ